MRRVQAGAEYATSRERCSGELAAVSMVAFALALLEAVALAAHLQDVRLVGELIQRDGCVGLSTFLRK